MYKVVRNALNTIVCYGPDDGSYTPFIPDGCSLFIEDGTDVDAHIASSVASAQAELADAESARQFSRLSSLKGMSPSGVQTYISNRYPLPAANLAEANSILVKMKDDIETLAIAVSILARRL